MRYYSLTISRGSRGRRYFSRDKDLYQANIKVCEAARMPMLPFFIESCLHFSEKEAEQPGDKLIEEYAFFHNRRGWVLEIERADSDAAPRPDKYPDLLFYTPADVGDGKNVRKVADWKLAALASGMTTGKLGYVGYCYGWASEHGEAVVLRPDGWALRLRCAKGSRIPYRRPLRRYRVVNDIPGTLRPRDKKGGRPANAALKIAKWQITSDGHTRTEAMWEEAGRAFNPPLTAHQCAERECALWGTTMILYPDESYVKYSRAQTGGKIYRSGHLPYLLDDGYY